MEYFKYSLTPNYDEIIKGYNHLISAFGKDWVDDGIKTYLKKSQSNSKKHISTSTPVKQSNPIIIWIHLAREAINRNQIAGSTEVTQDLYRASNLGYSIQVLTEVDAKGAANKIREIKRSVESARQFVFELSVASTYAKLGYKTEFITEDPVNKSRTPDMGVEDGRLEIECKMIGHRIYTPQETELFHLLTKRTTDYMKSKGIHRLIKVALPVEIAIAEARKDIEAVVSLLKENFEGAIILASGTEVELWDQVPAHSQDFSAIYHHLNAGGYSFSAEGEAISNPKPPLIPTSIQRVVAYKIKYEDAPVKAILKAIKNKLDRKQLSGKSFGLIYVHLNKLDGKFQKGEIEMLKLELESALARSSRADGIVLMSEYGSPPGVGFNYFAITPRIVILKPNMPPWIKSMAMQPIFSQFL